MKLNSVILQKTFSLFVSKAGLKKLFGCRHPTLGLQIGSAGQDFSFDLVKVSLVRRALALLDIGLVVGKWTFICKYRYNK